MAVLRHFLQNASGNVATIFGIMILPVLMLAGVGVDYARIASAEENMQQSVDNAVGSLASDIGSRRISAASEIEGMINANSGRDTAKVRVSIHQNKMRVDAIDEIDTPLLSLIGREKSEITARAELDAPTSKSTIGNKALNSGTPNSIALQQLERRAEQLMRQLRNNSRLSPSQLSQMERDLKRQIADLKRKLR